MELQCVCRAGCGAKATTDGLFAGAVVALQRRSKPEPSACTTGAAQPYTVPDGLTLIASRMTPATVAPRLPRLKGAWPAAHHFTSTHAATCTAYASHLSPAALGLPRAGTSFASHAGRRRTLGPRALCITHLLPPPPFLSQRDACSTCSVVCVCVSCLPQLELTPHVRYAVTVSALASAISEVWQRNSALI